ncbi:MAG: YdcF family protein [Pseudomonadota bacterium]
MTQSTDAIVVLTGGKGRVELGFSLFNAGLGKRLFISGVYPGVKAQTLASKQNVPTHLTQRLSEAELEYTAQNTAENAIETAKWADTHGIKSIRLVTGDYHVQRSLIEFKKLLPDVSVIVHPVHAQGRNLFKSTPLLWNEYVKLTFVWMKYRLTL